MAKKERPDFNSAFENPLSKSTWDIKEPPQQQTQPPAHMPAQGNADVKEDVAANADTQTHTNPHTPEHNDVHRDAPTHTPAHIYAHIDTLFAAKKPKKTIRKHFLCEKEIDKWLSSVSQKLDVTEGEIIRMALYRLKDEMDKREKG